jgi:hypothetical protein
LKFSIGWWIAIDAMFAYPSNNELLKASHTCGALATVALIMFKNTIILMINYIIISNLYFIFRINSVTNNQVRGESMYSDGCFGKTGARIW